MPFQPKTECGGRAGWHTVWRWGMLFAAVALAWPWRSEVAASAGLPALSPFVALCSVVATKAPGATVFLALPVLALTFLSPRWFCRHACPTGFLQELVGRLRAPSAHAPLHAPPVGKWLLALTVVGAFFGYPLFLWLDPLAVFSGFLNSWRQPLAMANIIAGFGLPVLLLFNVVFPRLWCSHVCPLGATQEMLAWSARQLRERTLRKSPEAKGSRHFGLGRRSFLGGCAVTAGLLALGLARKKSLPLRPPGAVDEGQFTTLCVRCGNCAQACPSNIIQPDFGESGVAGWLTPILRFDNDYCREDCSRCGHVCPSGALSRLPLARKRAHIIGTATVDPDRCLLANGRECTACIKRCPSSALDMHSSDGGFSNEPRLDPARCNGCGACEAACPVRPQRAIRVVREKS